jgi:probable blue pigment (indigoidine) exporter
MLCWGSAYVPSAWLVDDLPPLAAAAARLGAAGLIVLAVLVARGHPVAPGVGAASLFWLALTQTTLFYGATFWGIAHEGAGLAAVLANTDPLFVAALGALFLGDRLTRLQWTGLGVGFVGVAVAVGDDRLWPPTVSPAALVVVGGAFAWGIGTVVAVRGLRGTGSAMALAGWQMLLGAGVLALASLAAERGPVDVDASTAALVVVLGAAGSAAPLALFYVALRLAPAGEVSAWFFLVPVVGVLTAWPLLGETPGASLVAGVVGVALGLWLVVGAGARGRIPSPGPDERTPLA